MLMLLKNILGELRNQLSNIGELRNHLSNILGDVKNPQEVKTGKLENRGLSCQSFSEILRISEKIWHETNQNFKIAA
jgi:hypothetical protein